MLSQGCAVSALYFWCPRWRVLYLIVEVVPPLFSIFAYRHGVSFGHGEDVNPLLDHCYCTNLPSFICVDCHCVAWGRYSLRVRFWGCVWRVRSRLWLCGASRDACWAGHSLNGVACALGEDASALVHHVCRAPMCRCAALSMHGRPCGRGCASYVVALCVGRATSCVYLVCGCIRGVLALSLVQSIEVPPFFVCFRWGVARVCLHLCSGCVARNRHPFLDWGAACGGARCCVCYLSADGTPLCSVSVRGTLWAICVGEGL